jgi:hypothetical protein
MSESPLHQNGVVHGLGVDLDEHGLGLHKEVVVHSQFILDHIKNSIFDNWLASVLIDHLDHHGLGAQDVEHVVSSWVLLLSNGCKIVNLLLGDSDGIINFEAI